MKHQSQASNLPKGREQNLNSSPAYGFTLIEILVSMALLSIMAGIGVSLFAITNNSYNRANRINLLRTQGSQTLEQMERSIRSATNVTVSVNADGSGGNCPTTSTPGETCYLTLTLPSDSIDYQASSANCSTIQYEWIDADLTNGINGRLTRTYSNCTLSPTPAPGLDLFGTDPLTGVSVELTASTPVFRQNQVTGSNPPTVTSSFTLLEGVNNSKGKPQNRASIPFTSTTSLRYNN